jgi:hypothetical protein
MDPVVEYLPSKHEAPSSNLSTIKKKKKSVHKTENIEELLMIKNFTDNKL